LRDERGEIGGRRAGRAVEIDGEDLAELRARVATRDERVRAADHDEPTARAHVTRERGEVLLEAVRLRIEVLQDDRVEGWKMLAEELVHRNGMSARSSAWPACCPSGCAK